MSDQGCQFTGTFGLDLVRLRHTLLQRDQDGDREKAMTLLDESLSISTELGMQPLMERLFRLSGFAEEADQMVQGAGGAALSDRILDAVCLIGLGSEARCQEQLSSFRDAGVGLPILMGPLGVEGARSVINAFGR